MADVARLQRIDHHIVHPIHNALRVYGDYRILVSPDHPTPVALKTHVREPVPFLLAGPGIARNGADRYDEAAAAGTGMTLDPGRLVMDRLLG